MDLSFSFTGESLTSLCEDLGLGVSSFSSFFLDSFIWKTQFLNKVLLSYHLLTILITQLLVSLRDHTPMNIHTHSPSSPDKENHLLSSNLPNNSVAKRLEIAEISRIKLQHSLALLRERIPVLEAANKKIAEEALQYQEEKENERKHKQTLLLELKTTHEDRKRLEEWLNTANNNYSTLQRKYQAILTQNQQLRSRLAEVGGKYESIVKRKSMLQAQDLTVQKQLNHLLAQAEDQLKKEKEKSKEQEKVVSRQVATMRALEDQQQALSSELSTSEESLRGLLSEQRSWSLALSEKEEVIEQMKRILSDKESELQDKDQELSRCEGLFEQLLHKFQSLLERNQQLQSSMSISELQNIQKLDNNIEQVFQETERMVGRVRQWNKEIARHLELNFRAIKEQYGQLEMLYDRMLTSSYQSSLATNQE